MSTVARPSDQEAARCWTLYLATGDESVLAPVVARRDAPSAECTHGYPHFHRVADVFIEGQLYRIMRCVPCGERLTIAPIAPDLARVDEPGVPHWLQGEALRRWVNHEAAHPLKGPMDWEQWRPSNLVTAENTSPPNGQEITEVLRSLTGQAH